jgi:hypothetical protein
VARSGQFQKEDQVAITELNFQISLADRGIAR